MTATIRNTRRSGKSAASRLSTLLAVSALALTAACASPEEKVAKYSSEAAEFLEEGDLNKAFIQYQNALKINEEHVPSLLGLAEIAEQRQDFQAMFGLLQRAVRLDPNLVDAHVNLGKLYLIGSDETTALEEAEKALAIEPNNIDAKSLKAGVLLKIGDSAGAMALADEVIAEDPANAEAVTVRVTQYSINDGWEKALAELNRALEINPQIAMLQLLRIHALTMLDRADDARSAYGELIELFPDQPAYRRVYANELIKVNDFAGAREQLEGVVALQPENLTAKLDVVRAVNMGEGQAAAEEKLRAYAEASPDNTELQFALADFYIGSDQDEKASSLLDSLAASKDLDVALKAKNKITTILFAEGETEQATALVDEILAADQYNTEALLRRAALQIDAEEYDQAINNLRAVIDNSPDTFQAMILMAAAFERQDNYSFAQSELAKAFEASKKNAEVAQQFARFLLRRKNVNRAEEVLKDSLAVHPNNVENLRLLASIRLAKQDWRGAEEVGQMLADAGRDNQLASTIKSAAYIGLQDFGSVIETLSEQNEDAPLQGRPLSALIDAYIREERTDEAKELLTRMLETDPENYAAQLQMARIHLARGEKSDYEATLLQATETAPQRSEAFDFLYRHYLAENRRADASELIERGLRAAPENDALKVFKADVLLNSGDREGALDLYSELIEKRPDDRIIANNFVSLSSDMRKDEVSIARALEVAKTIESIENPYYRDTVGWAYYRAGDYAKAIEYLSQAVAAAEDNPEMRYHLGAAQAASGDKAAARDNLEKALSLGGANLAFGDEAKALLASL
ncbi:tetratricopeptide repeat protein [Marinicaulis aureus]|uniref:Tetratricopeptide repeat protein n=1 Tax=Hyphococcus aureus TaxID=2666033 RepID=A0ABW1L074_9PROT